MASGTCSHFQTGGTDDAMRLALSVSQEAGARVLPDTNRRESFPDHLSE